MFKGVSQFIPLWVYSTLVSSTPSLTPPYPSLPPPIIQQLSVHIVVSATYTDVMDFDIVDAPWFSFPFPPPLSSIEYFHFYKHVLHIILFVFVYMFIFWISLPRMRENRWPLSFCTWLTSLNMMSFIYLQTTWCHSSLWLNKTPLCVYTPQFLDPFISHFHSLLIVNNAAISIGVQVTLFVSWLAFLWIYAKEWYHWITWQFCL
jgi:hypothetical protein